MASKEKEKEKEKEREKEKKKKDKYDKGDDDHSFSKPFDSPFLDEGMKKWKVSDWQG